METVFITFRKKNILKLNVLSALSALYFFLSAFLFINLGT